MPMKGRTTTKGKQRTNRKKLYKQEVKDTKR